MTKIDIKTLCDKLNQDEDEKVLFFKVLSAPEFLIPFMKNNVFNLIGEASFWEIKYLQQIFSAKTRDNIIKLVNLLINQCSHIELIQYGTYMQILELFENFKVRDIEINNYSKLLEHSCAIELVNKIYAKKESVNYKELIKLTIKAILKYKINKGAYGLTAKLNNERYLLIELINNDKTRNNLEMALQHDSVFTLLISEFIKINAKIKEFKNNFSDVIHMQIIDKDELKDDICNDYNSDNLLNIIMYFLCLNMCSKNDQSKRIEYLLGHELFILRKLGLYIISQNVDYYLYTLEKFFKNVNDKNIINVTQVCSYELINIFKRIQEFDVQNKDVIISLISDFLKKFPIDDNSQRFKYEVLHGLKRNINFQEEFNTLKEKFGYEKDEPGIFWRSGIGGWVNDVAPINKEQFEQKTIEEQIDYINSEINYEKNLKQIDKDSVEEVNERGLVNLFKETVSKNIDLYVKNKNICRIKKTIFVQSFLEVVTTNLNKIKSLKNIFDFIASKEFIIFDSKNKQIDLIYSLIEFNTFIVQKSSRHYNKIFKYIKKIAESNYENKNMFSGEDEVELETLNSIQGRNFYCYMEHLIRVKELNDLDKNFVKYILNQKNQNKFYAFYYYLGIQYQYLSNTFNDFNISENIEQLETKAKICFLYGYLSYFTSIKCFCNLKRFILNTFKNKEIKNKDIRKRLVRVLFYNKMKYDEDDLFAEFENYFLEEDYICTLTFLVVKNNYRIKKQKIINYCKKIIQLQNKKYLIPVLSVFNKYCKHNDIGKYKDDLISVIKLGLPENLIVNREFAVFLNELLEYQKNTRDVATTYDILDEIIESMRDVKYYYKELDIVKDILLEFKSCKKLENAKLIANKIYDTKNLKYYATNLKEFLY